MRPEKVILAPISGRAPLSSPLPSSSNPSTYSSPLPSSSAPSTHSPRHTPPFPLSPSVQPTNTPPVPHHHLGTIQDISFHGNLHKIFVKLDGEESIVMAHQYDTPSFQPGQQVTIHWHPEDEVILH
nr:TOBE domain-containing protein [Brevibacillus dissolubilis]